MTEPNDLERLRALDERLARLKKVQAPEPNRVAEGHAMANHAWRMVTELVAGLLIGFGIGYGLDVLFGTLPVFLAIFSLVGFAAGVRTMLGTARQVQEKAAEAAGRERD